MELLDSIKITLDWDTCGNQRKIGYYNGEYEYTTIKNTLVFTIVAEVSVTEDSGDYFNPPSYNIDSEDIQVRDVKVYSSLDELLVFTDTELIKIENKLKDLIKYD